jgi:hypothetical protein
MDRAVVLGLAAKAEVVPARAPVTSKRLEPGRSGNAAATSGAAGAAVCAAKHFTRWYFWAIHSRLQPVIDAARTLKGPLSYFADRISYAGGPEPTHPSDPRFSPRLPQPRALQDRHILPPRRVAALPANPRTSRMSRKWKDGLNGTWKGAC